MLKANYHTHCYRCKHAVGTEEEYILTAIENGYEILGMSAHMPIDYKARTSRMDFDEIDPYLNTLYSLKEKYKNEIKLFIGFEAEYLEDQLHHLYELKQTKRIDYLVFGNHYHKKVDFDTRIVGKNDQQSLYNYLNDLKKGLDTGLYSFIAHPDVYMGKRDKWDETCIELAHEITKLAIQYDIALEYNCEGLRNKQGYPDIRFWQIAKNYNPKVIIGADAHEPKALHDFAVKKAIEDTKKLGLNVITYLDDLR